MESFRLNKNCAYNINYHLVWCPKRRKPVLLGNIVTHLQAIIEDQVKNVNGKIVSLAIQPDHVHLFVSCPPTVAPHRLVKMVKGASSGVLRAEFPQLMKIPCLWSRSYYCGTIGSASESVVKMYIENQKHA